MKLLIIINTFNNTIDGYCGIDVDIEEIKEYIENNDVDAIKKYCEENKIELEIKEIYKEIKEEQQVSEE